MTSTSSGSIGKALSIVTATSLLSPLAGLVVAPILARAFDPEHRGILAAALAPSTLVLSAATLGLPDALTYFCAKARWRSRALLLRASGITAILWLLLLGLTVLALPALSSNNSQLSNLIVLSGLLILPALLANLLRGAAFGLHAWNVVAVERVVLAFGRVLLFGGLFLSDQLTLVTAVVVSCVLPAGAGLVYMGVCFFRTESVPADSTQGPGAPDLIKYGLRVWLGSIAGILLARVDQLLMTPLSSAYDLGIYAVAVTISELPMVAGGAVQSALFGLNSRDRDAAKLAQAGRLFFILAASGCTIVALTLPLWIGFVFGDAYRAAIGPTVLLLVSSLILIPANSAGTALNAWGRPGLRSFALIATLLINIILLFTLVPRYGVIGACCATVAGSVIFCILTLALARRVTGLKINSFVYPRVTDLVTLYRLANRLGQRILRK